MPDEVFNDDTHGSLLFTVDREIMFSSKCMKSDILGSVAPIAELISTWQ